MDYDTASIPEIAAEYAKLKALAVEADRIRVSQANSLNHAESVFRASTERAEACFAALCKAVEDEGKRR